MKNILSIHKAGEPHWVGDGFPVRTVFHYGDLGPELTPFLLLDHAGPATFEAATAPRGVDWHPHRGFETVTVVYEGEVDHEDTAGNRGSIGPGDVQWMTAGAGVLHKEFHSPAFTRRGGRFEVLQLWVNLPAKSKMTAPRYQGLVAADFPGVELPGGAGSVRVLAGEFGGARGPASTFTPVALLDVRLRAGKAARLPLGEGWSAGLFVLDGRIRVNGADTAEREELAVFQRAGRDIELEALADARLFVMAGEPIDEPIAGYGPFVMNTQEEIRRAFVDFHAGRLARIPTPTP
ncbi:MAG TPA: pirin family protein [Burkholderiales bacterium]|nr:pirin family protein [Burkholderiales bacterium]